MRRRLSILFQYVVVYLAVVAALVSVLAYATGATSLSQLVGTSNVGVATAVFIVVSLLALGGSFVREVLAAQRERGAPQVAPQVASKPTQEQVEEDAEIEAVSRQYPGLGAVLKLMRRQQLTQQEQQRIASRRSFWQGAAQNFVFYVLGIVTPIILVRLHLG
jgi:hypothetical protein